MSANIEIADDLIEGAVRIGQEVGFTPRRTFNLLERKLMPGFKIGGKWYARRSTLRNSLQRLEAGATA